MELTTDIVAIQGILSSIMKQTGDFTKINCKGGNEDKIVDIMTELQIYLMNKNYVKNGKINTVFNKELEEIVFFLAINTVYEKDLFIEECAHLMNIVPPLSKCLFSNIVYGLDLCEYFSSAIEKLPLQIGTELLDEANQCLKKSIPKIHLQYATIFLKSVARKLESTEYSAQNENDIDNFTEVSSIMLSNLTGIYSDHTKNMKQLRIYQHMGYCLLNLFDLLLMCKKDHLNHQKFIRNIIGTCCFIVRIVTIDVYCSWAEIEEDEKILQLSVSEKAYLVIESYHKYNEASELISMLSTFAKKPLSLTELIEGSDVTTIIRMVNKKDNNQEAWFKALFTTQVFKNKEALDCIGRWPNLCNEDGLTLLLNLSVQTNDSELHKLIIKCATCLNLEKLIIVCTRHFYRNNFSHVLNANIEPSLTILFNKLNENHSLFSDLSKEVILLLLQNPIVVLTYIKNECVINKFYTDCLIDTFEKIKEISKIDNVGIMSMEEVLSKNTLNCQNVVNYSYLFRKLQDILYFTKEDVVIKILLPLMKQCHTDGRLEELTNFLQIFIDANISIPVRNQYADFIEFCLQLMKYRCKFLNFDGTKQEIVRYVVDIIYDLCDISMTSDFQVSEIARNEDCFLNYYAKYLSSDMKNSFFKDLCPDFDINNYGSCVSQLLQILPSSVTREWLDISEELIKSHGITKCMELLTDIMILLSQLVETQNFEENKSIYLALNSCIKNCGNVVQQKIQRDCTIDVEEMVAKQVCRIIAKLPDTIKEQMGLLLLSTLSERSLKSLATNREFLCLVILIKNSNVCKVLAEKMKSSN